MVWSAPERLWYTADHKRVVSDGDPEARYLFAGGKGDEIPRAEAMRLGLIPSVTSAHLPPDHVIIERGFDRDTPREAGAHATIPNRAAVHGPGPLSGPHAHEHDLDPQNGDSVGAAGVRQEPGEFFDHVTFAEPVHSGNVGEIEPVGAGSVLAGENPSLGSGPDAGRSDTLAEAKGEEPVQDDTQAVGGGYKPATEDKAIRGPQQAPRGKKPTGMPEPPANE